MNLIERAKNMIVTPKTEWDVVAGESDTLSSVLTSYVIWLAAIPAAASLVGSFLLTQATGISLGIKTAVIAYVAAIAGYVITTYVVDLLAGNFKSEKDLNKSAQLVAYASTASWIAGIFNALPIIGMLGSLAGGIYAIYLMYLGLGPIKKTPEDQKVLYLVIVFVVMIVTSMILASLLRMILLAGSM
ncbi:MAG TPA: Yip1 family protein [Cyclobacteriaceae bacterium]|nr:Yip1 family protein [Cyclobacteriaceae bacterium]